MEELEGVMFDEGDFEVVDECTGEEDPSPMETDKQAENSQTREVGDEEKGSVTTSKAEASDGPDFTEDVTMDQVESSKEDLVDDDAIRLDASDVIFIESKDGETKTEGDDADDSKETDSVVELISPEHEWYEEKINAKMTIVKERLSKLARVLELSYPAYKPWLEHSENSVCHLDPPRRCPLDKPHTNRWKFICSRKTVQESTNKEEDSAEGTVNKKLETVWQLGPTDGSGVNTDNASQYPPFVMRVVKVFEEFIQSIEQSSDDEPATDQESQAEPTPLVEESEPVEAAPASEATIVEEREASIEEIKVDDDVAEEITSDEAGYTGDRDHNWLWLLVRSNSKDELMLFATGKKISEPTMQKLKQTFESGPGKDCNVKSLYCKSINSENASTSNITFLAGTEALDESVGGVKIQLAPKTNFWSNASGVEQLGRAVDDMLSPLEKVTVVEVGCGLGLIGLMLAPKSKQVIGLDAPSEVEEAEMTCELNKIKNASFIKGEANELMTKATTLLRNTKAVAVVNGNTKLGRDIEVMTALRKIPSLRRVVMITTLTKQSVRAILELTRPLDADLGNPFMPVRAILVDTLPTGPHFEVVIRMERLNMQKINESWFWDHVKFRAGLSPNELPRKNPPGKGKIGGSAAGAQAKSAARASPAVNKSNATRRSNNRSSRRNKMRKQKSATRGIVLGAVTGVVRNPTLGGPKPTGNLVKNPMSSAGKTGKKTAPSDGSSSGSKRSLADERKNVGSQPPKESPSSPDPLKPVKVAKSSKATSSSSPLKKNPLAKVQQTGRGQRLSGAQKRKRHSAMIEAQRQAAAGAGSGNSGPAAKRIRGNGGGNQRIDLRGRLTDPRLMQQVQEQRMLLGMAQQRINAQGPMVDANTAKQLQNMLSIVLDQTNKLQSQLPRSVWDRIAPPPENYQSQPQPPQPQNAPIFRDRYVRDMGPQAIVVTTPNREFGGNQSLSLPLPLPLFNRPPLDRAKVMPAGMSPLETRGGDHQSSQQGRPGGSSDRPQGRDYRKNNQANDWNPLNQYDRARQQSVKSAPMPLMEPIARPSSPKRGLVTPPRSAISPPRRYVPASSISQQDTRRALSPPLALSRRQASPPRRPVTPPRNNPHSEIFQRRPISSASRQQQQQQTQQPQQSSESARRDWSSPSRHHEHPSVAPRGLSPPRRFADDWDRGTMQQQQQQQQQGNWNQRQQTGAQIGQRSEQRGTDRNITEQQRWPGDGSSRNWDGQSGERYRQSGSLEKPRAGEAAKDGTWMSGGGDVWNSKQASLKPSMMESGQWGIGGNDAGPSGGDRWNSSRGGNNNDGYGQSSGRMDNRRNSGRGEKDWSDLPEDAKDPWAEDLGGKSRWQQGDKGSSWGRDDKGSGNEQNWSSNRSMGNNWQNKGGSTGTMSGVGKPLWPLMGGQGGNEQRSVSLMDSKKSGSTGNWQGGGNDYGMSNWRQQNYSGFSQQSRQNAFGSNSFKDGR